MILPYLCDRGFLREMNFLKSSFEKAYMNDIFLNHIHYLHNGFKKLPFDIFTFLFKSDFSIYLHMYILLFVVYNRTRSLMLGRTILSNLAGVLCQLLLLSFIVFSSNPIPMIKEKVVVVSLSSTTTF